MPLALFHRHQWYVDGATERAIRLQEEVRKTAPEAFDHFLIMISLVLSNVTPKGVMGLFSQCTVDMGTPFLVFLSKIKSLVSNIRSIVRYATPGDPAVQAAVKACINDQYVPRK